MSREAIEWLMYGERGLSSEAMFYLLVDNNKAVDRYHYPSDPDDWQRCERLLRAVPELRERLFLMSSVGPEWAALVAIWPTIAEAFDREAPGWFDRPSRSQPSYRAPITYGIMDAAIQAARRAGPTDETVLGRMTIRRSR